MKYSPHALKVVDISAMQISDQSDDVLVTYSLGSCVGVTLFDPDRRIGGMIHCLLPVSLSDKDKAKENPFMFVDTGVVKLIQSLVDQGSERSSLVCKIAGAGAPLDDGGRFRVGEKNLAVLRRVLEKNRIAIQGECVGGSTPKTLFLELATGRTIVRLADREEREL